jgi:hypothetical protein
MSSGGIDARMGNVVAYVEKETSEKMTSPLGTPAE